MLASISLTSEEGEGKGEYLTVDVYTDVAHNACAERHEACGATEIGSCLEHGEQGEYDAEEEECGGWSVVLDEQL